MKVKFVDGAGLSQEFDLDKEIDSVGESSFSLWIGRAKSCYIVINDISISREHAQLQYVDSKWFIKSTKRMMINGTFKEEGEIKHGDVISFGHYSFNIYDDKFDESFTEGKSQENKKMEGNDSESDESNIGFDEEEKDHEQDTQFVEEDETFQESDEQNEYKDGESFDSGYEIAESEDNGTKIIKDFSKIELDIFGEGAPYDTYIIEKEKTVLGRNPDKCEIVLSDPEVSGVHAIVTKSLTSLILEDMNSGNGTLLNGERINKKELLNGDEFVIGSITFTVRIESDFIESERLHLMPVEENQFVEVEEEVEIDEVQTKEESDNMDGSFVGKLSNFFKKDTLKDSDKRKKILYAIVGILLVWLFLDSPEEKPNISKKKIKKENKVEKNKKHLDPVALEAVDSLYHLALELFETGKYRESMFELDKIFLKVPDYKNSRLLYRASKDALREIELIKKKERELKELVERKKKVEKLLAKAEGAVKDKRVGFAEQLFAEIAQLDPENLDVVQLKIELDHYKKEQERKAIEKAAQEAERSRQERSIVPGKNFYSQKKWYFAILEFEKLIEEEKQMDKDLLDEVNKMLLEARESLNKVINPLFSKAKSMREGKDFKGAYESYLEILKHEPGNIEALNEMSGIKEKLRLQSRRAYREAIISESLSLFDYAKEKFQEVQQISPVDSEYYKKSTEKLKNYLE